MDRPLGRRTPEDWTHVVTHPLTAALVQEFPAPRPAAIGVNWYREFDQPVRDKQGHYWIARDGKLTHIRGGHCVCLKAKGASDPTSWWDFYDQGSEGSCVGFGCSRMMSQLNRKRYFARWLWDLSKATDEWPDTNPGDDNGTSVHAAADILRKQGHVLWKPSYSSMNGADYAQRDQLAPSSSEGINAVKWATSADQVLDVLGYTGLEYVDLLNSWGRDFPHMVRMTADVLQRLIEEDGEVAVVTDRP